MSEVEQKELQDWASRLAASHRKESDRKALEARKALSDRAILKQSAAREWQELQAEVGLRLSLLERALQGKKLLRLVLERDGNRLVLASVKTGAELQVLMFHACAYRLNTTDGTYDLRVDGVADVGWHSIEYGASSRQTIATVVVERAFRLAS